VLECVLVEVWASGAAREIPQNLNFFTKTNQILPNQISAPSLQFIATALNIDLIDSSVTFPTVFSVFCCQNNCPTKWGWDLQINCNTVPNRLFKF
jgi:hypothetical protein